MIKFISYDGEFPNVCRGTLTSEKDGKRYELRNVLISCGNSFIDAYGDGYTIKGPWRIDSFELPRKLQGNIKEIEELVNEHVEHGCCGGCI